MNSDIQEKRIISYDQFIAGAILKFKTLDNIDFSLLVRDFEEKTNTQISGFIHFYPNSIGKYVVSLKDGTIKLRKSVSLDDVIEEKNQTLRDILLEIAGDTANNYFNNLDIETYLSRKEKTLEENKKDVLNTANVLLISDIPEDYDELIKYGFKNIDYFKSIIRADQYFAKHLQELKKYHIIINGHQATQRGFFDKELELNRKCTKLECGIQVSLSRVDYSDHISLRTILHDKTNHKSWEEQEMSYANMYDRIVENTLINRTLEEFGTWKDFVPIQESVNPNRLPLPTQKSDLKILFLDSIRVHTFDNQIAKELGLKIYFKEDNNSSLSKYVVSSLGKYDIIIASDIYSRSLLYMNNESTEQCKDTGKELTLLVTYDDLFRDANNDLAGVIQLNFSFGGNFAPDYESHSKKFKILNQPVEMEAKDEYWKKWYQAHYAQTKSIIEVAVNYYNQALIQNDKSPISDLDFKTADQLTQEYEEVLENKKAIREAELAPIKAFDHIRNIVFSFLSNLNKGLITCTPEGLKITRGNDSIKVEITYNGKSVGAIVFSKNDEHENLRIFEIQTLSKKGSLTTPQRVALYTSEYEGLENIPNRPNETQDNLLSSIQKKVNYSLLPLNKEALIKNPYINNQNLTRRKRKKSNR